MPYRPPGFVACVVASLVVHAAIVAAEDRSPVAPPRTVRPHAFDPSQVSAGMARLDSAEIYYAWHDYASVVRVLSAPGTSRPRAQVLLGWALYRLDHMPEAVQALCQSKF